MNIKKKEIQTNRNVKNILKNILVYISVHHLLFLI